RNRMPDGPGECRSVHQSDRPGTSSGAKDGSPRRTAGEEFMIDLHTHTNASDGTLSPPQLVSAAAQMGLEALAITDHDTFSGYEEAVPYAARIGIDLVCGIELSTKHRGRSVHLLGYFLYQGPSQEFRTWVAEL